MTVLNFAPIKQAFNINLDDIKKHNEEVNKLKTIDQPVSENTSNIPISPIPTTISTDIPKVKEEETTEQLFLKLIKDPDFESLFIRYIKIFKPELLLNKPSTCVNCDNNKSILINGKIGDGSSTTGNIIEYFGKNNMKPNNYFIFLFVSLLIYILLSFTIKR